MLSQPAKRFGALVFLAAIISSQLFSSLPVMAIQFPTATDYRNAPVAPVAGCTKRDKKAKDDYKGWDVYDCPDTFVVLKEGDKVSSSLKKSEIDTFDPASNSTTWAWASATGDNAACKKIITGTKSNAIYNCAGQYRFAKETDGIGVKKVSPSSAFCAYVNMSTTSSPSYKYSCHSNVSAACNVNKKLFDVEATIDTGAGNACDEFIKNDPTEQGRITAVAEIESYCDGKVPIIFTTDERAKRLAACKLGARSKGTPASDTQLDPCYALYGPQPPLVVNPFAPNNGNGDAELLAICRDAMANYGGTLPPDPAEAVNAPGVTAGQPNTCDIGAIGWIVCPVINFLDNILGGIYGIIENFLIIDNELIAVNSSSGTESPTHQLWSAFRDIANIIFVILLMVVIFSQVTSIGIGNYGVKKILPKLIIAALLINLSYYICQIFVDLSNIVGSQLKAYLESFPIAADFSGGAASTGAGAAGFFGMAIGVAGAGIILVVLSGGMWGALFAIIAALLAGLLALLLMFAILTIRKVAVVLLVALSPLAFVCYMLPNTEGLFKKWSKTLQTMLLLFPICGLLIGGGKVVGRIISASGSGDWIMQVIGAACVVLPYFAVFALVKGALNGLGAIGQKVSGLASRASKGARSGINKKYANSDMNKFNQKKRDFRKKEVKSGNYQGRGGMLNPYNLRSGANRAIAKTPLGGSARTTARGNRYEITDASGKGTGAWAKTDFKNEKMAMLTGTVFGDDSTGKMSSKNVVAKSSGSMTSGNKKASFDSYLDNMSSSDTISPDFIRMQDFYNSIGTSAMSADDTHDAYSQQIYEQLVTGGMSATEAHSIATDMASKELGYNRGDDVSASTMSAVRNEAARRGAAMKKRGKTAPNEEIARGIVSGAGGASGGTPSGGASGGAGGGAGSP